MNNQTIKETLEKQLQLLSERSAANYPGDNIAAMSEVMLEIAMYLNTDMPAGKNEDLDVVRSALLELGVDPKVLRKF